MNFADLALTLLQAIVPLITASGPLLEEIGSGISALEAMHAAKRGPTEAEVATQQALLSKLSAALAAA